MSLNPNAILIRSRILVFVDSTRAFDKSCSSMFSIAGRCLRIFRARSTNGFSFERDAQANQSSSRWQPWAPSIRVCPGTPGEDAGVWTLFGSLATAPGDHDSAECHASSCRRNWTW